MVWGNKADCEASTYLKVVGSLIPKPPPGTPGPFALSENSLLERLLKETGLNIISNANIASVWDYPDVETALKGLISAGPVARAIEHSGYDETYKAIADAIKPYVQTDGRVVYHNKYRMVIAIK